jgi:hypothetical protein
LVFGVVNQNENAEPLDENAEKKNQNPNSATWYWEIWLTRDDESMLVGPLDRVGIFEWIEERGYEIPEKMVRLKPLEENGR